MGYIVCDTIQKTGIDIIPSADYNNIQSIISLILYNEGEKAIKAVQMFVCLLLVLCLAGSIGLAENVADLKREAEAQLDMELGAFEITAMQREMARDNAAGYPVLDAGRGNPNWINTQARYAFSRFMDYAVGECERTMSVGSMAGQAQQAGIGARFDAAMDPDDATDTFLIEAVRYCVDTLGMDRDALI